MPVADHAIHASVIHAAPPAGCHNRADLRNDTMSRHCRQIGRKLDGEWMPLVECIGCTAPADLAYIHQARAAIDIEMARFIKADQRCA